MRYEKKTGSSGINAEYGKNESNKNKKRINRIPYQLVPAPWHGRIHFFYFSTPGGIIWFLEPTTIPMVVNPNDSGVVQFLPFFLTKSIDGCNTRKRQRHHHDNAYGEQ
eukprot:TRINITY_DN9403_c0_g1_i5.p2 TRINITY_DN9403_c0_g1~~TRINITY_DN9403_c0_g1_i5.p2  ORF type:complete len:108 (+),score=16.68 TRINITY_DN9403_c0_g1_i5:2-325(+)